MLSSKSAPGSSPSGAWAPSTSAASASGESVALTSSSEYSPGGAASGEPLRVSGEPAGRSMVGGESARACCSLPTLVLTEWCTPSIAARAWCGFIPAAVDSPDSGSEADRSGAGLSFFRCLLRTAAPPPPPP
ncbi:hypothetical protein, partial [Streptomyces regalis]|uniref:hypothetical protein n=1 Tax=Streptomyces regalis TaxID=68262 RepID=UPI001ABEEEDF